MSKTGSARSPLVAYQGVARDFSAVTVNMAKLLTMKRHPDSQVRHAILIHSMFRAARTCGAQLRLSEELYSEEMHCVNRALAEISINAAYLQIATEPEVDSYLRYDAIATARVVQKMSTSMPKDHRLNKADELHIRQLISQPRGERGAIPSWSLKSITLRARELDKSCGIDLMSTTALMVYETAHPYVHGTASSVEPVGDWIMSGANSNDPTRLEGTIVALHLTCVCLLALTVFTGQRYQLGLDSEVERLQETLNILGLG